MRKILLLFMIVFVTITAVSCGVAKETHTATDPREEADRIEDVFISQDEEDEEGDEAFVTDEFDFISVSNEEAKEPGDKYEFYSDSEFSLFIEYPEEDFLASEPLYFYIKNKTDSEMTLSYGAEYAYGGTPVESLDVSPEEEVEFSFYIDEDEIVDGVDVALEIETEDNIKQKCFTFSFPTSEEEE